MNSPCLILDVTDAMEQARGRPDGVEVIPHDRRPTVLQPDLATAEREALRLAGRFPGRRFAVFRATALSFSVSAPTHISFSGEVLVQGSMPVLSHIGVDERAPF